MSSTASVPESVPDSVPEIKPKKKAVPATHPAYKVMVTAAITTLKVDDKDAARHGSSRQAIVKYIKGNYTVNDNCERFVKEALLKGVTSGELVKPAGTVGVSGKFKLGKVENKIPPKPKKTATTSAKMVSKKAATKKKKPAPAKKAVTPAKKPAFAAKKPVTDVLLTRAATKKPVAKKPGKKAAVKAKKPAAKKSATPKKVKTTGKKAAAKKVTA